MLEGGEHKLTLTLMSKTKIKHVPSMSNLCTTFLYSFVPHELGKQCFIYFLFEEIMSRLEKFNVSNAVFVK